MGLPSYGRVFGLGIDRFRRFVGNFVLVTVVMWGILFNLAQSKSFWTNPLRSAESSLISMQLARRTVATPSADVFVLEK